MTRKTDIVDDDMALEKSLQFSLNPVQPNPEFVYRLRDRLTVPPSITIEARTTAAAFVFLMFGLFAGVFLIWLFRTIFKILSK